MSEWESLCRRCGQCCFEKWIDSGGRVRHTGVPCRHLDAVSRECRVYSKRLDVGEGCVRLTPENVLTLGWLPADCAYLQQGGDVLPRGKGKRKKRKGRR
jgi:uncharacterized cysteine cluster protein YcgN (CxxCxxCC family)